MPAMSPGKVAKAGAIPRVFAVATAWIGVLRVAGAKTATVRDPMAGMSPRTVTRRHFRCRTVATAADGGPIAAESASPVAGTRQLSARGPAHHPGF